MRFRLKAFVRAAGFGIQKIRLVSHCLFICSSIPFDLSDSEVRFS